MTLGEIVKAYRDEHQYSQRQMSALCGVSTGYISLLEKGINPKTGERLVPTIPLLQKIAKAMGRTLDELLSAAEDSPINISLDVPAVVPEHDRKEIALQWIREEATVEEKIELLRELANLL